MHDQRRARRPSAHKRLARSHRRYLAGVCGGIAQFVGVKPTVVRLLALLSLFLTGGLSGLGYLLLWWLLPSPRSSNTHHD
ncbi:MAG: PspC domain-containing protein [Trueperaceae bacterium]|nr:MAG: PspC domain-containing protein [Trueperaceae bacterium]